LAQLLRIADNRAGYLQLVDYVRKQGRKQASRNGDTLEVDDMVIQLLDPTKAIPSGVGRRNYSLALAHLEGLQLVAGDTYDDLMVQIAPNTDRFRENDGKFHGAYGRRISGQMPVIVERLKEDPDTRQAVVTLWNPELDALGGKSDHPCTCLFNWRVREGKLLMSTFMRSQDVHWGWPYDVVMFTTLQLTMAAYLGVEPGAYTHHAASFHIYTKDLPALSALQPYNGSDLRVQPLSTRDCVTWADVMKRADSLVYIAQAGDPEDDKDLENGELVVVQAIRKRLVKAQVDA
jgi:thymidylate synthase